MKKKFLGIFALLALLVCASCSKDEALLDSIPADADVVALFDVEKLCKNMNVSVSEDGTLKIPSELSRALNGALTQSQIDLLGKAGTSVDLAHVYVVQRGRVRFATFAVEDEERFNQTVTELAGNSHPEGDFDVYALDEGVILARGEQAWAFYGDGTEAITAINDLAKEAKEKSFGKTKELSKLLDGKQILRCYAATSAAGFNDLDALKGLQITGDVEDNSIVLSLNPVGAKKNDKAPTKTLDTGFLSFVPEDAMAVGAVGLNGEFDWETAGTAASAFLSSDYNTIVNVLLPFVKDLDGTLSVAVMTPTFEELLDFSPEKTDFIIMAQTKKDGAESITAQVKKSLAGLGLRPTEEGDMSVYRFGDRQFRVGTVEGYCVVSTREVTPGQKNSFAGSFQGHDAAFRLRLPRLSELSGNLPATPAVVSFEYGGEGARLKISLPESKNPILLELLK